VRGYGAAVAVGTVADLAITTNKIANGAVTAAKLDSAITTDDINEGSTNLYYTDARADARIAAATTTDLTEGTNLYYTDTRVDARLASGNVGNIITTGYLAGPATFTIDPAAVGENTGTVVIAGNLQVDGTTTTINSTTVEVDDLNLTLASGAINAAAADGAGITVDGAGATLTYNSLYDSWTTNKELRLLNNNGLFWDIFAGGGSTGIKTDSNDNITFRTGGFWDRLVVADTGYVGFNTNNPQTEIHLAGASPELTFSDTNANDYGSIHFQDGEFGFYSNTTTTGQASTNGTKILTINKTGGINVNDPDSRGVGVSITSRNADGVGYLEFIAQNSNPFGAIGVPSEGDRIVIDLNDYTTGNLVGRKVEILSDQVNFQDPIYTEGNKVSTEKRALAFSLVFGGR